MQYGVIRTSTEVGAGTMAALQRKRASLLGKSLEGKGQGEKKIDK